MAEKENGRDRVRVENGTPAAGQAGPAGTPSGSDAPSTATELMRLTLAAAVGALRGQVPARPANTFFRGVEAAVAVGRYRGDYGDRLC